jgi:hypothetical protein
MTHYLLTEGDTVQDGDEMWINGIVKWHRVHYCVGVMLDRHSTTIIRRKIPDGVILIHSQPQEQPNKRKITI